jgi:hypothetical protein
MPAVPVWPGRGYCERVDGLADSSGLAGDVGGLRQRLAADGYLFFRGVRTVVTGGACGGSPWLGPARGR